MHTKSRLLTSIVFTISLFISPAQAHEHTLELAWELQGFSNPESVIYDAQLNHFYVSNVNGAPNEKAGNGFISIVSFDGRMIQEKWMIGLNAPKGLAIHNRTLYVADIDELLRHLAKTPGEQSEQHLRHFGHALCLALGLAFFQNLIVG